ncbi:DUF397 domain-containing protein [Lentzea sp. PSKA42]|uniref:DUF397 domain-containing protein n=1 Tax=Lentzea indica TaxID=2604800 RepID=A0ABX1FFK6_9PSEU|nr:DUF397 domain-containing protein [Lentzea indica]NKE57715.1 DUF397 domain-containing protein [Lentzea indica]
MTEMRWRKSTASSGSGTASQCVEVCLSKSGVQVRDSKNAEPGLRFPTVGWKAFLGMVFEPS